MTAALSRPSIATPSSSPLASDSPSRRLCRLSPQDVVRAALHHHALDPAHDRNLARRLRLAALLPRLSARASGLHGQGLRYDLAPSGPEDYGAKQSNAIGWEVRLTWDLPRLLFDGREVALLRERRRAARSRQKLVETVLMLYFAWKDAHGLHRNRLATRIRILTGLPHSVLAESCRPVAWSDKHDPGDVRGRQEPQEQRARSKTSPPLPHRAPHLPAHRR